MEIVNRRPADLRGYERNARTHSEEQVGQIADSIREFGFNNPILIDENDRIIAGHGRLAAAIKTGLPEVPCIVLSHLSEAQRRAYILVDNRLGDLSVFDEDVLRAELSALSELEVNLFCFDEMLLELDPEVKTKMEPVELSAPSMSWFLVGVPITMVGEIQPEIESIARNAQTVVFSTVADK